MLASKNLCADVYVFKASKDNYMYLVVDKQSSQAACIDPLEPHKIIKKCSELNINLVMCITTHNHWDHAGGNEELKKITSDPLKFLGSAYENSPCLTHPLKNKETALLGSSKITAYHAPCHTKGHMLYYITNESNEGYSILFTGDTLFVGGCGRFFEGNAQDMMKVVKQLEMLDGDSRVFVGHEYTLKNLLFAKSIEPENKAIDEKIADARDKLQNENFTVPSILKEEFLYNPFLRCHLKHIIEKLTAKDAVDALRICRQRKDLF